MYFLDLFSGIGGFALGAYWAGLRFDEHYFSEIDSYCLSIYSQRFPEAIGLGDIKKIDCESLPKGIWIISGGFPCQDISIAGKGEGIKGARSSLWFAMWEFIRVLRPQFAIIENVPALTFRGLVRIYEDIARINYSAQTEPISATELGANHRRKRLWMVAYPNTRSKRIQRVFPKEIQRIEAFSWCQNIRRVEDLRGRSDIPEPLVRRINDGVSFGMERLKALGNSIVPQIAELLFRQIREILWQPQS